MWRLTIWTIWLRRCGLHDASLLCVHGGGSLYLCEKAVRSKENQMPVQRDGPCRDGSSARGLRICVDAPLSIYARAPCLFLRCVLSRCSFLGRRSVLSLKASKRSTREFRGASCLPNANSVQGKSELSLEGSGKRDSCLTNSLERDKKTGAPELNAGCGHLSSSVQNQAAAYPSSRRPTFDGGRAAGMGTGSNAGSRCHGRSRLSNPGQPFS